MPRSHCTSRGPNPRVWISRTRFHASSNSGSPRSLIMPRGQRPVVDDAGERREAVVIAGGPIVPMKVCRRVLQWRTVLIEGSL
ncbi:MAG: hypothetical protein QOG94_637 [Solirubrobacteraceae bacterium]|nr:hypothetical protein [Solirubrobacteraceae bacterium]